MNGPIARAVAIVCHANAVLRGAAVPRFFPNNSTCRYCDRIDFVEFHRGILGAQVRAEVVANTPDDWFKLLKTQRIEGLRLGYGKSGGDQRLSDRMSAGFVGGGGEWSIASFSGRRSSIWMARETVWNQQAPEQRIWRVSYCRVGDDDANSLVRPSALGPHADRLHRALSEIAPFARKHDCEAFAECFQGALRILDTGSDTAVYHADLAPQGCLPRQAETMLAACQKAWVFGGMGSWNDMGFEGQEQDVYERVSEELFQAVNAAIVAATNASWVRE